MPIIMLVVAVAMIALGGAMYFKNVNETAATPGDAATTETTNSGIANMLGDAKSAADAMENGIGGNTQTSETITAAKETSVYADGAYTKTGTYTSPAGEEKVTISITLADDIVASATFDGAATNPGSIANQKKFAEGYTDYVIGKSIDEISMTVVNGSSLTPEGFMNALEQVKAAARM